MTQEGLDVADIDATVNKVDGDGVAELVLRPVEVIIEAPLSDRSAADGTLPSCRMQIQKLLRRRAVQTTGSGCGSTVVHAWRLRSTGLLHGPAHW